MDIREYWRAVLRQNEDAIREYFHKDALVRWHNTDEQFTLEEFIRANCEYPGEWDGRIERLEERDGLIIAAVHVYTADRSLSFHVVSFLRIRDDKIQSADEYWGDDGPAPQWRLDKKIGTKISRPVVQYRTLTVEDAEAFWRLQDILDHETRFMMYDPGERKKDIERVRAVIQDTGQYGDFLLAVEVRGELVGFIAAQKGRPNRIKHTAYVVTGIREAYRGNGIGTEFFCRLDQWAATEHITRMELTVMCYNEAAIHLYEKFGFVVEGIRKNSMIVDGHSVDEYYMAKVKS